MAEKKKTIGEVMKEMNKKYDGDALVKIEDMERANVKSLSTNCYSLDYVFGCNGIPSGRIIELFGAESCQPAGSKVLMSDGCCKNIEDVHVGDMVVSPQRDGTTQHSKVLHTTSWECPQVFSVNSKYGNKEKRLYSCSFNHIIPFYCSDSVRVGKRKYEKTAYVSVLEQMTAKELCDGVKTQANSCFSTSKIESFIGRKDPKVGPYSLGMLLANAHLSDIGNVVLSSNVHLGRAIVKRMIKEGVVFTNGEGTIYKNKDGCIVARLVKYQSITKWLGEQQLLGKNAHGKFIPESALFASAKFRERLLAGLLEGDGYFNPKSVTFPNWEYATVSKRLAENVATLVFSLGGKATVTQRTTMAEGKKFPSFRIHITMPHGIEMANTKKEGIGLGKEKGSGAFHSRYPLVVRSLGKAKVFGITISSPSQWYVTDNWMVTHNSGKSTMAMYLVAQVQKTGGKAVFIDAEFAFNEEYARKVGVDVKKLYVSQPSDGEEAWDIIDNIVKTGDVDIIIIDSVASLVPKKELDGEISKENIALQARLMSKGLRRITGNAAKTGTTLIFINQVRDKVGVFFGNKTTTSGGRALKFYASIRLEVKKGLKIKGKDDEVIGNWLSICGVKNKIGHPWRTVNLELIFEKGIDIEGDVLDSSVKKGIIGKNGMTYTFNGIKIGCSRDSAKKYIVEERKVFEEINNKLNEKNEQKAINTKEKSCKS